MAERPNSLGIDVSASNEDQGDPYPRRLTDRLWVLGNRYFNIYLVIGEQASAIIEVGVSAVVDQVIEQLRGLRVRPSFLVVTHPHADHLTGLDGLKEKYRDALIIAGEGAPDFLSHPGSTEALVKEDSHMGQFLESKGIKPGRGPIEDPPLLGEALTANEGDEMDLGGLTLRFLEVKGHAPGTINVYVPEIGALFASDSLGFRLEKRGFYPLFFTSFADHVVTLARLEKLSPRILGVAHMGPRMGPQAEEAFEQSLEASYKMRERIRSDLRGPEAIAQDLYDESYNEEFLLYSPENIAACISLLVKRARE